MARAPVFIPPGSLVEFTVRTRQGRKLLRPDGELTELVHGILGRALSLFDVKLHAFTFLSNHQHQMARVADAEQACAYIGYVNRNTSRVVQKVTGWADDVWSHTSIVPILDDAASLRRLKYILANGVKEGLVDSPLRWPGPTGVRALLDEKPIEAWWAPVRRSVQENPTRYPIDVHPLPVWSGYPSSHRRRLLTAMIYEIEQEGITLRGGRPPLGVAALRSQDRFEEVPLECTKDAPPLAHFSREELFDAFIAERRAFIDTVRRPAA